MHGGSRSLARRLPGLLLPLALLQAMGSALAQPGGAAVDVPRAAAPIAAAASPALQPAQRTALATRADLRFGLLRQRSAAGASTLLAWLPVGQPPQPVARLDLAQQGDTPVVTVQLLPHGVSANGDGLPLAGAVAATTDAGSIAAELALATLEQLYSLLLRQEPGARYCLQDDLHAGPYTGPHTGQAAPQPAPDAAVPDCPTTTLSQAEALRHLAALRTRAVQRASAVVPWQVVVLQPGPQPSWDADLVTVQATGPQGPLAGLAVYFNRAPHSICQARTGTDGVASCRLEDQHADGHQHDHAAVVVATFPGDLRPDRVWLPTTGLLRPHADAAAPAFASRWRLPGPAATP
jgi:hypothetical protein